MRNQWKPYRLSEFAEINPKVSLTTGTEYPFIEMKDLNEMYRYVEPSRERLLAGGARFENGDTLFARITPCLENGKICQANNIEGRKGFGSTEFMVFRGRPGISDSNFVYYLCKSPVVRRFAEQNLVGTSGRQRVSKDVFDDLELNLPPLPLQQHIAEILSSLDDKIELNRKMSLTLEEMAKVLFKHYFIDGIEKDKLPKGWNQAYLSSIGEFLNGAALQKFPAESFENSLPVIKIRELKNGISQGTDRCSREIPSKYILRNGDLLFSWSGTLEVGFWTNGEGALNQHLFKVTSSFFSKWFLYEWLLYHLPSFKNIAAGKATTMGHIQRHHLDEALIWYPVSEKLEEIDKRMAPLIDLLIANKVECVELESTRNYLLPRLISGDVVPSEIKQLEASL